MEKWTKAQKTAIESKGSTLITASAGTGKTAVLTEKVASLFLTENIDISQILVMTFSNAAAEEMKTRIANKLIEMTKNKALPLNKRRNLFTQVRLLHTANIKTIHAFCNDIVKKYYYEVGLSPDFAVGNNFDIAILKRKAIKKVLSEEYQKNEEVFIELLEYFDASEEVEDIFINAYDKIYNNIDPKQWMENAVALYDVESDKIPDFIKNYFIAEFEKARDSFETTLFEIEAADEPKLDKIEHVVETDLRIVKNIISELNAGNVDAINSLSLADFGATVRFPAAFSDIKDIRNKGKDIIDKYKKANFNMREQLGRMQHMHHIVKKFTDIISAFADEYSILKKADNIIDFSDMEKFAYAVLNNAHISNAYKNIFKYVFVDEYQDTSPIQEAIITRIAGKNNLFCVGDQKQSIYRFRSSEPELFMQRDKAYREKTKPGKVIALNNNFRSGKNILDCSNDIFFNITRASKEITYSSDAALVYSRKSDEELKPVNVMLLDETFKDLYPGVTSDEMEVYSIVNTIKEKMTEEIYDPAEGMRPVKYSDIVILCRKLSGLADIFVKIFTANKIPFIIESSGGLLGTAEIQHLMQILNLSNNINNDLFIISFMHEGFMDFTDEDLAEFRKMNYEESIINNIYSCAEKDSDLGIKCAKFLSFFKSIKEKEKYLGLNDLVNYIISELNFIDYYAIQDNGRQKVANIKLFQEYIFNYEQKHHDGILGFINYIKDLNDSNTIIDEAKVNYDENSIKITTIHKSKGLEYPIVILPFMAKAFSIIDKKMNVNVERTVGLGFRYSNLEKKEKGKTIIRTIIENVISDKNKEEEMRLLYVAMTRAKEELIIQGTMGTLKTKNLEDCSCMLDWVLATIMEDMDEKSVSKKLKGLWELNVVDEESLTDIIEQKLEPVDDEVFINRYSLPVIKDDSSKPFDILNKNIPVAVSASMVDNQEVNPFKKPEFKTKKSSARKGTVMHTFLKYLDFSRDLSITGLVEQEHEMLEKGVIKKDETSLIDLIKIEKFFAEDPLAESMKTADKIEKERSMAIMDYSDSVGYFSGNTKKILIRCVLDLMFEKNGKWYLVDYKTDKINDENDNAELTAKIMQHRSQISLYERAIKEIYDIDIEKSYLVFLDICKSFELFKYEEN